MASDHRIAFAIDVVGNASAAFARIARAARDVAAKLDGLRELIVVDPATWKPESFADWLDQAVAIILHEFWMAADRPHRSPGAVTARAWREHRRHTHIHVG